jgi:predicted transcriptional regulator of viral defense system
MSIAALSPAPDWRDEFVLVREARTIGAKAELLRKVRAGTLLPVARGVYRHSHLISQANPGAGPADDDRYLSLVRASQLISAQPLVYSHHSAAALWRLPTIGSWPTRVHVTAERESGNRSTAGLVRHGTSLGFDVLEMGTLRVTSLARTVVDIARVAPFATAVAMADAALAGLRDAQDQWIRHPVTKFELQAAADALGHAKGIVQCRAVISFADGKSESAGESLRRVGIMQLGFPAPVLQRRFTDHLGSMWTDFWWPEFNLAGEFDGRGKYLRDEYLRGRSTAEAVINEKVREDRLRALGPGVTRWDWPVARSLPALRAHLLRAGLRPMHS